jgi:hypothetical protein
MREQGFRSAIVKREYKRQEVKKKEEDGGRMVNGRQERIFIEVREVLYLKRY